VIHISPQDVFFTFHPASTLIAQSDTL